MNLTLEKPEYIDLTFSVFRLILQDATHKMFFTITFWVFITSMIRKTARLKIKTGWTMFFPIIIQTRNHCRADDIVHHSFLLQWTFFLTDC